MSLRLDPETARMIRDSPKLTADQLAALLTTAKAGGEGAEDAKRAIVAGTLRLAARTLASIDLGTYSPDDALSEAIIATHKALDGWLNAKCRRFVPWLRFCILRRITAKLAKEPGWIHLGPDDLAVPERHEMDGRLRDFRRERVRKAVADLPEKRREYIHRRFGMTDEHPKPESLQTIADEFRVSRTAVSDAAQRGLADLRRSLAGFPRSLADLDPAA